MTTRILDLTEEEQALVLATRGVKEQAKILKPFGKFIVLQGSHFEALDQKMHGKGDSSFWASSDLVKRFGDDKFRRVALKQGEENISERDDQLFATDDSEEDQEQIVDEAPVSHFDTFDSMTVNQLRKCAIESEVDLGDAKTKPAIIAKLRQGPA